MTFPCQRLFSFHFHRYFDECYDCDYCDYCDDYVAIGHDYVYDDKPELEA